MTSYDDTWPDYVYRAFAQVYYGGGFERKIEAFEQRWGGLDSEAFERVIREGTGEDKVIAIFALGYINPPHVCDLLAPLLQSPVQMERWASAIVLGDARDERALPVLHTILQKEALFPPGERLDDERMCYIDYREMIVSILGNWGQRASVPILRAALESVWGWELQLLTDPPDYIDLMMIPFWQTYQYELAYALGQLGAFGGLTGIAFSDSRRRILMIYMALGYLQISQHEHDIFTMMVNDESLKGQVAESLARLFGLSEAEQHHCITHFVNDYFQEGALETKTLYFDSLEKG